MSVKQAFLAKKKRSATRSAFSFRAKCRLGTARGLLIQRKADLRKLFKSTLNHRLHRHLACVIYKRYRSAKLKRAFEELPKRATALNGGSHLAKSKERFAGGLPTERSARFGKSCPKAAATGSQRRFFRSPGTFSEGARPAKSRKGKHCCVVAVLMP